MKLLIKEEELEILDDFLSEANEYLENIEGEILILEERQDDDELVNSLFRRYHSMKGLSGFFEEMGEFTLLCQVMEEVLSKLRNKVIRVNSDIIDLLLKGSDVIKRIVNKISVERKNNANFIQIEDVFDIESYINERDQLINSAIEKMQQIQEKSFIEEDEEAIDDKNDEEKTEEEDHTEVIIPKSKEKEKSQIDLTQQIRSNANTLSSELNEVRISYEKVDEMLGLVGEIITTKSTFFYLTRELEKYNVEISKKLSELYRSVQRTTELLQDQIMKIRMITFETIVKRFNRLVRETAKRIGKKVKFSYSCNDVVIDKGIAEKLSEPLMHIIRNCIDHGIEMPDERKRLGKSEYGKVDITTFYSGRNIVIEVSDDGKGINREKILKMAIEHGLIAEQEIEKLSDEQILNFIFKPGFSTKEVADEISGRGVGMDVVKTTLEALKGNIKIDTATNVGTRFTLEIPTMAAISQGIVVLYNSQKFIIPFEYVEETIKIKYDKISGFIDRMLIDVRDEPIPLYTLSYVLYEQDNCSINELKEFIKNDEISIVILNIKGIKIAVCVEKFLHIEEFVLKRLPKSIESNKLLMGATIDYEGNVVLVLNPEYFRL